MSFYGGVKNLPYYPNLYNPYTGRKHNKNWRTHIAEKDLSGWQKQLRRYYDERSKRSHGKMTRSSFGKIAKGVSAEYKKRPDWKTTKPKRKPHPALAKP